MYDVVLRKNYDIYEVVDIDMKKTKDAQSLLLRLKAQTKLNGAESDAIQFLIDLTKSIQQMER